MTVDLTMLREKAAEAAHEAVHGLCDCDGFDSEDYDLAAAVLNALDVPALIAAAEHRALRDAADAWTQGQWSNVMLPKPTPPAVPVIAYANRVGDWLRARAASTGEG